MMKHFLECYRPNQKATEIFMPHKPNIAFEHLKMKIIFVPKLCDFVRWYTSGLGYGSELLLWNHHYVSTDNSPRNRSWSLLFASFPGACKSVCGQRIYRI